MKYFQKVIIKTTFLSIPAERYGLGALKPRLRDSQDKPTELRRTLQLHK